MQCRNKGGFTGRAVLVWIRRFVFNAGRFVYSKMLVTLWVGMRGMYTATWTFIRNNLGQGQ